MPWSYRPALDGLRTVAVYAVLLFHTGHPWALGGFVGVDLFFVLSGFLVTSVLLSEIDRTGTLKVGMFYTRRVRRLLPAAVVAIVATCAVFVLVTPVTERVELVRDAQSALLYVANWHFLVESGDYFATDVDRSPFLHFWSLAIEEQFYLLFPLVLLGLTRTGRRVTVAVLAALMLASVGAQLVWAQVDPTHAYYGTDARIYQPLAGAVLALVVHRLPVGGGRRWGLAATAGLALFLLLSSGLLDIAPSWRGLAATVAAVTVVAAVSVAEGGRVAQVLAQPVLVFLGKISYGTYLWHWPVILVLQEVFATSPRVVAVLTVALSTGLAALSYEVLEKPIRTASLLDRLRWTPAVAGVAVSALLAFTLVPGLLTLDRKPALAAESERPRALPTQQTVEIPDDVDWDSVVKDHGEIGTCAPDEPEACIEVEGSGPHLLLVGDSQAQSLVPMFRKLAEEHDFTLSINVVPGCLWQEELDNADLSDGNRQRCEKARVGWYDEALPELEPDVVVLMTRPRDNEKVFGEAVSRRDGKQMPLDTMTLRASRSTLRTLEKLVPQTLIVNRIVMPETFDPADCLTTEEKPTRCAVPVPVGGTESDSFAETLATASDKVEVLDLNPAFCPGAPVCMPVVGDEVVWRDDHHVTASFATARRDVVWEILNRYAPFGSQGGA
ncbi:acyltransferase family protein [Nocardioides coralli]|uniref:acyltransferase family protein n=1 Tax=Nocardioides coralli TaxID=2872154 RepID=UPI001CA426D6|nr:acyltransferase family protein [Nocardioides coralli]QZY28250.1 acyltransferase [Nocardioides coralli]